MTVSASAMGNPHATQVLRRKHTSAITEIAEGVLDTAYTFDFRVVSENPSKPHWQAWLEFYTSAAATTLTTPTTSTYVFSVSPTSVTGYDTSGKDYFEAITNGTITIAAGAFSGDKVSVNWSGHTEVIRVTASNDIVEGATATHFRLVAWEYYA